MRELSVLAIHSRPCLTSALQWLGMRSRDDASDAPRKLCMRSGAAHPINTMKLLTFFASLWYLWLAHAKERKVNQMSTKDVRLEVKRLKACIQEVNETRVAPL
jgi:hypothetical protein